MLVAVRRLGFWWAAVTETNNTRRGGLTTALGLYMGMFFNSSIIDHVDVATSWQSMPADGAQSLS